MVEYGCFSNMIEAYEAIGQQDAANNSKLPKLTARHEVPDEVAYAGVDMSLSMSDQIAQSTKNIVEYTRKQYELMGIEITEGADDVLYKVKLPEGWKLEPTSHSMWLILYDNKRRPRAKMFYKADFLGGSAHISFLTRYSYYANRVNLDASDYDAYMSSPMAGYVLDGEEIIYTTPTFGSTGNILDDDKLMKQLRANVKGWLDSLYPDHANINAYWD